MPATAQTFTAKTDFYGIAEAAKIKIVESNENKSSSVAELTDECGDVANYNVFAEYAAPSCKYELLAALSKTIKMGGLTTVGSGASAKKFMLTTFEVATVAGQATSLSASGVQVEADVVEGCTCSVEVVAALLHHAQILFSAFQLSGGKLQSATYTISCEPSYGEADGQRLNADAHGFKIVCAITVGAAGSTPTLNVGSGWTITSPLTCSNTDSNYPNYTATLTQYLAGTPPAQAAQSQAAPAQGNG